MQAKAVTDDRELAKKFTSYAANTFVGCGEFIKAGELFMEIGEFRNAGECFKRAKKYDIAVTAFAIAHILVIII